MNIFNKFFLYLLLLPSFFYRRMGVHIPHLKAILTVKLTMDDRRAPAIQQAQHKKKDKPVKLATIGTMFLSAVMGCIFLFSFGVGNDRLTQFTIYFSFYIFILASMLIADFTTVLIDVRDNFIILPKPINDKTFLLSRLLHIIIHVCKLILPMSLPGMIYVGVNEGWIGWGVFVILVVAATLFTVFLINAIYVLILRVTTPEKFKNIISYFQIFIAILFFAGYQLVPRLMSKAALSEYSISSLSWNWLLPPYWFAAGWQYINQRDIGSPLGIYLLLSLLVPVVSIWIVIRYFAPSFNQKLSMISGSGSEGDSNTKQTAKKKIISTTPAYVSTVARLVTQKGTEHMSFLNTWKITGRSRDFKMKVYPSIGYLFVYLLLFLLQKKDISLAEIRENVGFFLIIVYLSGQTVMMAIYQLMYSDKFKAAWIYYITPIDTPGKLISGALKSLIAKFFTPIALAIVLLAVGISGVQIIPNLLLGIINQLLVTYLIGYLMIKQLPFSLSPTAGAKGGNFLIGLFSLVIPGIFGFAHYFLYKYTIAIILLCILSAIATWMVMDAIRNKSWEKIRLKEYEG